MEYDKHGRFEHCGFTQKKEYDKHRRFKTLCLCHTNMEQTLTHKLQMLWIHPKERIQQTKTSPSMTHALENLYLCGSA
jgi:hypothetical protein